MAAAMDEPFQRLPNSAPTLRDLVIAEGALGGPGPVPDLSGPLSIADLHICLDRIRLRSDEVKDRVYRTVTAHYRNFLDMINNASDTSIEVASLSSELNQTFRLLENKKEAAERGASFLSQDSGKAGELAGLRVQEEAESKLWHVETEIIESAKRAKRLRHLIQQREQGIAIVREIVKLQEKLQEVDTWRHRGELVQAAVGISLLRSSLGVQGLQLRVQDPAGTAPHREAKVLTLLREECTVRHEKLKATLDDFFAQAVAVDPKRSEIRIVHRLPGGGWRSTSGHASALVSLPEVFEAMETLGALEGRFAKLADAIFAAILGPILRDPGVTIAVLEGENSHPSRHGAPGGDATERQVASLRCTSVVQSKGNGVSEGGRGEATPAVVYPKVLEVIRFLRRDLMANDDRRMRQLGRILWPRLADAIIAGCLGKAVPSETSQLAHFQTVADLTVQFEASLRAKAFLPEAPLPRANEDATGGELREEAGQNAASLVGDRLSAYAADVEVHFASKKRKRVVAEARELLVKLDFTSVLVGGEADRQPSWLAQSRGPQDGRRGGEEEEEDEEPTSNGSTGERHRRDVSKGQGGEEVGVEERGEDGEEEAEEVEEEEEEEEEGPFFLLEPCQVTAAARSLIELVHTAMQEACMSTGLTAGELYRAARDALALYRAIVPVLHGEAVEKVPALGMLFQNDCLYIAHHLLTLGFQYRQSLAEPVAKVALFVDLVPLFRRMAEEACNRQLQLQHTQLMEALDTAEGFQYTDDEAHYRQADRALKQAVHQLERLAAVWRPLMPRSRFLQCVAYLADVLLQRVASQVLAIRDLAVEETVQLRHLLQGLLHRLPPLLITVGSPGTAGKSSLAGEDLEGAGLGEVDIEERVPAYKKVQRLTDLLDMSLLAITQAWESGDLTACGFSLEEVLGLVEAIFTDTPLRRECLHRMKSS